MLTTTYPTIVDIAFDVLPAAKGAAIHVGAFARALGTAFGDVRLITVADPLGTQVRDWAGVQHLPVAVHGANVIERALSFRTGVATTLAALADTREPHIYHVRSIFEGYPLVRRPSRPGRRLVFEVNGLPSIELKYHYPQVAGEREFLSKVRAQEQALIKAADLLITPSTVTAAHLHARGAATQRICVIENGVDLARFPFQAPSAPPAGRPLELLYAGTASAWQGIEVAMQALRLLNRELPTRLTVVGPSRRARSTELRRRARQLGLGADFRMLPAVDQNALAVLHHQSDVVLAPLLANDRNQLQGCCPLKVIEAMACGTPLVGSDLPVVATLARDGQEALLVRPNSAKAIKDAVLRLHHDRALAARLAYAARDRVRAHYTWTHAGSKLVQAYQGLLAAPSVRNRDSSRMSATRSARPS